MVDHRDTGMCVGQVDINDGPLFPEKGFAELVYEDYKGFGYATAAVAALRDRAGGALGYGGLVSYIAPSNLASIKVAERLEMALDPTAPEQDPGGPVHRHGSKA